MFDISTYDNPEAAERAVSFVRTSLLLPDGAPGLVWPSDLDVLPAVIAAEIAGSEVASRDRALAIVNHTQCPVDRAFVDAVFDACDADRSDLGSVVDAVLVHGTPGSSDRDDGLQGVRRDPLAVLAAGMVSDAVAFARGDEADFIMPASRMFADLIPASLHVPTEVTAPTL